MNKHIKKKKHQSIKSFDVAAYELHNNRLYRHKIIPNKKKQENLKRKKVDIREYKPFLLSVLFNKLCFYSLLNFSIKS
jgi:hypothetical protein